MPTTLGHVFHAELGSRLVWPHMDPHREGNGAVGKVYTWQMLTLAASPD